MIRTFRKFIEENELFHRDEKILLAVSGGVDSVVMLDLFHRLEMDCMVAHCNFNLRGEESDGDEDFVVDLAGAYGYPVFVNRFQTREYAKEQGISIEMAARDLRYNWFEELRVEQECPYIAVAHHSDDVVETLFINLCRGTGIRGLTGIKPKTGNVVRPMLSFSRPQLEQYASDFELEYRVDSSNIGLEYVRNKIRHQILPVLEEINPGIRQTLMENIRHFREVEQIYHEAIDDKKDTLVVRDGDRLKISIAGLKELTVPATYLFEWLSPYGFHFRDVQNIAEALNSIAGKVFYSSTHRVIRDREYLLVLPLETEEEMSFCIHQMDQQLDEPFPMKVEQMELPKDFVFPREAHVACVDAGKLQFPLTVRKWKLGDSFYPLGMKGRKKLSDFFIDQKFSLEQKENTWLLVSGEDIVWVMGHRLDDRFKITSQTERILRITIQ